MRKNDEELSLEEELHITTTNELIKAYEEIARLKKRLEEL